MRSSQALAVALAILASTVVAAQPADRVELTVRLDAVVSGDEAPSGDVTIEFSDASTREPVASWVVAASAEEQSFEVAVPTLESRSGWLLRARSEGWWSPAALIPWDEREASLTLVPEGLVRFAVDGTDTAVDFLETGKIWIDGRVDRRRVRLDRGLYGGPCEVDREPDRREVLITCPFARDEEVELRVRLGPFLPLLLSEVTVEADTDLGLVEPVRGARVTGSLPSPDGSSHQFRLRQRDGFQALGWVAWTDSGGALTFEGLSPAAYELRLAGSDGDSWPVRIESLSDQIDLGPLVSFAGNLLSVSFVTPSVLEIDLRPTVSSVTLGPDGEVERRERRFEFHDRGSDDSFLWRGLAPGDYEVAIWDDRGNRWGYDVLRFFGQDHHYVELDAVPLVGRVERGGEPLEDVMVWFGGMWGRERISFRSREEGFFGGLLPREGFWPVEVTPAPDCDPCEGGWDTDGWGDFDDREVNDAGFFEIEADSDGVARIDIDLAAGAISGRVVRRGVESGLLESVAGARVWVWAAGEVAGEQQDPLQPGSWRGRTDASGAFEVTGLPEWNYSIHAEAYVDERELQSAPLKVQLWDDERIEDVELRLADQRLVTVVVRSGGVPVAGAQTFVLHSPGSGGVLANSYSDGAAEATHYLSMDAEYVDVVVRAEGFGMNGWRFDVRDGAPVEVDLTVDRGSLRLPQWRDGVYFRDARLYTPGGASIRIGTLAALNDRGQIQKDGDEAIVNDLAPGTYTYCPKDDACTRIDILPWAESRVRE
ncbi:MAG: carboxypeptidase regulatory-like domain-containing protein [Holophagales bacterium]|nr:carboxypeptidase regulatory-like domain-containing protein [Holophagales bacterium]